MSPATVFILLLLCFANATQLDLLSHGHILVQDASAEQQQQSTRQQIGIGKKKYNLLQ